MYRNYPAMPRMLLQITFLLLSLLGLNSLSQAAASVEDQFLQGLQHLQQNNIAQANVSLARLPSQSPYAKLLAGNIAAQQGDYDQAFLLLLPLQSNMQLIKPAAASLHASLGSAYEKQGAYFNALEQLARHEIYLEDNAAIQRNHANIWRMLSTLSPQTLIELRGESIDSITQGWIDLALAAKQQDMSNTVKSWADSYSDHPALAFANSLVVEQPEQATAQAVEVVLKEGDIALILPFGNAPEGAKVEAFKAGLQAALAAKSLPNQIKTYSAIGDQESFADLYTLARDEGAVYVIGPMTSGELDMDNPSAQALTLLDAAIASNTHLQHGGWSLKDEAQAIASFAARRAIRQVSILASDTAQAQAQAAAFASAWEIGVNPPVKLIAFPSDYRSLLELKDTVAAQSTELLILAMSAQEAVKVKPYLDIGIPTIGFSSLNNLQEEKPVALHAVRFVDMPFLTDLSNNEFSAYREAAAGLQGNELKRWFALGVDYLALLAAKSTHPGTEMMVNGLTGTTIIDADGQIARQLQIARFTHDSIVLDQ
jgi:outer membrane PBP1 activator LpoA protein